MGFRINTNVAALSAHANALSNNRAIDSSLGRLNSGFRINSAADDASGMAIADSLRSQASSLGKAIMNANDAIGIVQTADKAMDEQIKILDTIKEKAIQSAQDGQTTETRKALQADISRLMEELDNIGNTTSFNGQKLLSGTFSNKEFQIGAYSNETVKASIGATTSDKIGLTRFETGHNVRASDLTSVANFTFKNVDGINDITFEPVQLADDSGNIKAGMGLGALMEAINKASDKTGVKASVTVQSVFEQPIKAGSTTAGFSINGVMIGAIDVKEKDGNGALRSAINSVKDQTGVEASVDSKGRLVLANRDGRGIKVEDNVGFDEKFTKPVNDMHELVTNDANKKPTLKKGVDLNLAETWTIKAGETGSILNDKNTFADVKMAHGTQDALIYKDGVEKVADLPKVPKIYNDLVASRDTALATLKTDLKESIKTNILDMGAATGKEKEKAILDGHAMSLQKQIDNAVDLAEISDLLTKFTGSQAPFANNNFADENVSTTAGTGAAGTGATGVDQKLKTALVKDVEKYAQSMKTSVETAEKAIKDQKLDITKGSAKTLFDGVVDYKAGIAAAVDTTNGLGKKDHTVFAQIATLAEKEKHPTATTGFFQVTAELKGKEIDLTGLKADAIGALNLSINGTAGKDNAVAKDVLESFKKLQAQTTVNGANTVIDEINKKLETVVKNAAGKTMDTTEAQQGMIAHSFLQFFAGVKAGLNEGDAVKNGGLANIIGLNTENSTNFGRLSLASTNGRDIQVEVRDANGFTTNSTVGYDKNVAEKTVSLRETNSTIDKETADAMGFNAEEWQATDAGDNINGYPAGVMTLKGAQAMMNIAEAAAKALQAVRSDLGSVQNQLVATVNNISVTQVNVKAAESNIRDVDFAQESATFSKHQILAQSGVYAMSQANAVQQNVMRLLQ